MHYDPLNQTVYNDLPVVYVLVEGLKRTDLACIACYALREYLTMQLGG